MNEIKSEQQALIKSFVKEVREEYLPKLEEINRKESQLKLDPTVNEKIRRLKYAKEDEYEKTFDTIISWIESGMTLFAYFIKYKCVFYSLEALIMQSKNAELLKYLSDTVFLDARTSYLSADKES